MRQHAQDQEPVIREAAQDQDLAAAPVEAQAEVAGEIPPVLAAAPISAGRTASELAYDDDDNVKELKAKVAALVKANFGGDYRQAFDHYDADSDGGVKKAEIKALLKDAGVGNGLTRGGWADGILEKVDQSKDGKIQWPEFQSVFGG